MTKSKYWRHYLRRWNDDVSNGPLGNWGDSFLFTAYSCRYLPEILEDKKFLQFYLCVVPIFPRHLESTRSNSALNYSPVFSARGESAHGTCDDVTATVPSATASRHWSARISDITWNLSADWLAAFPASHSTGATIGLRWTADVTSCWVPFAPWVVYREHVWDGAPQSKVVARCGQSECFRNSEGPVVCKLGQSVAYYYAACFFPSG